MYCSSCGKLVADGAQFCGACGAAAITGGPTIENRPIAGIAVGTILGVIGVAWSIPAIFRLLYSNPAGLEAALFEAFPALPGIHLFGALLGLLGNSALLIGVLLAFLRNSKGNKTVRITSYCTSSVMLLIFLASYSAFTGSTTWPTLDASTRGSLIGGLIGGVIGGLIQWGLVLFLFRKKRWP